MFDMMEVGELLQVVLSGEQKNQKMADGKELQDMNAAITLVLPLLLQL